MNHETASIFDFTIEKLNPDDTVKRFLELYKEVREIEKDELPWLKQQLANVKALLTLLKLDKILQEGTEPFLKHFEAIYSHANQTPDTEYASWTKDTYQSQNQNQALILSLTTSRYSKASFMDRLQYIKLFSHVFVSYDLYLKHLDLIEERTKEFKQNLDEIKARLPQFSAFSVRFESVSRSYAILTEKNSDEVVIINTNNGKVIHAYIPNIEEIIEENGLDEMSILKQAQDAAFDR